MLKAALFIFCFLFIFIDLKQKKKTDDKIAFRFSVAIYISGLVVAVFSASGFLYVNPLQFLYYIFAPYQ